LTPQISLVNLIQEILGGWGILYGGINTVFNVTFIKVLLVGISMMVFQQLVGINMMIYYAPTIFGYAAITGTIAMMTVPTVNMLFTFPAIWLVEKWGRKKLLYIGAVMMFVTMIAAGMVFRSTAKYEIPVNKSLWQYVQVDAQKRIEIAGKFRNGLKYRYPAVATVLEDKDFQGKVKNYLNAADINSEAYHEAKLLFDSETEAAKFEDLGDLVPDVSKVILLMSIIVYIFGFAFSWGPIAWLICSEFFPLEGREIGMTVTTMVNWLFAGIVMGFSLTFMKTYGNASIFFVFAICCVFACIFLYFFVPETKGVSLEEIEKNLKKGKRLRNIGDIERSVL